MVDEADGTSGGTSRALTALAGQRRTLREMQEALFLDLGNVPRNMSRFWILLVLSAVIASAGILADSTATVIGAMIIAPLGMPIMGTGFAVVTGDGRRMWTSAATGFAGSYGLARRDISDIMPGVAIAISLVPPLAVAGITASAGDWASAWGALLLFATNVVAMIVAGTIVFGLYGYHRTARQTAGFRRRGAYAVIVASVVAILVPLGLTTAQTAREQTSLAKASATARPWAGEYGYKLLDVRFEGPDLEVVIEGTGPEPADRRLLLRLRGQVPVGTPVVVETIAGGLAPIGPVPA